MVKSRRSHERQFGEFGSAFARPGTGGKRRCVPLRAERFLRQATLFHDEPAVFRLAQVLQLRRNACRRVVRELRQLIERQPRLALPRAEHHVS